MHALAQRRVRPGSHLGAVALLGEQDVGCLQVAVHHLRGEVTMQAGDPQTASRSLRPHHELKQACSSWQLLLNTRRHCCACILMQDSSRTIVLAI